MTCIIIEVYHDGLISNSTYTGICIFGVLCHAGQTGELDRLRLHHRPHSAWWAMELTRLTQIRLEI